MPSAELIRFGPFSLDVSSWELRRLDRRVKIRPQACIALAYLISRSGEVVTREELCRHLWKDGTFVDFEHSLNFCIRQIRKALGEHASSPQYLETIPRRGYRFNPSSGSDFRSLAILPFENRSGDAKLEYLSDGITESLIRQLAQLPNLRVMGRTTVFRFKGGKLRPEEIGRRLGVGAVLAGRVEQREGRLSIAADLIDVQSGLHLWGEHYDRSAEDVVLVQQEICGEICGKLRPHISGRLRDRVSDWGTTDIEAYHLYLRGRHFMNRSFGDGFHKVIQYFRQAIERDPVYALPYAAMADCYGHLGFYGVVPPKESWPRAKAAAAKALEIDDELAEGYASMAIAELFYHFDPEAGYKKCCRAMELNPSYQWAYFYAAACLLAKCLVDEAAALAEKAQQLDPLSALMHTMAGLILSLGRHYKRAETALLNALELEPQSGEARRALGITYIQLGHLPEAIRELERARVLLGDTPPALGSLGRAYGRAGRVGETKELIEQMKIRASQRPVAAASIAAAYVALGSNDLALDWLEKAADNRSSWLVWSGIEPWWDPLRNHPRFQDLLDRLNLRQYTTATRH